MPNVCKRKLKSMDYSRDLLSKISEIDRSDLKADFDTWPSLASASWNEVPTPSLSTQPSSVVIAGMGGSGIIAELISDIATETATKTRIVVVKDYHLPSFVDDDAIVVGVSCSGNTEETLSVLLEARKRGLRAFNFGTGGMLEEISNGVKSFRFVKTRMLKVPRSSFPGLFYPVLRFFLENGLLNITSSEVKESLESLFAVRDQSTNMFRKPSNIAIANAKALVGEIGNQCPILPLVYASRRTRAVGLRFRQSLNENTKIHAFDGLVPELCHNEVVGWDGAASVVGSKLKLQFRNIERTCLATAFLELPDDPREISVRIAILKESLRRKGATMRNYIQAPALGDSYLSRIISMLYLLDYSSYYAAILRRVDPIQTPSIDFLKAQLKARLDYLKNFEP